MNDWQKHEGPRPSNLDSIPKGGVGLSKENDGSRRWYHVGASGILYSRPAAVGAGYSPEGGNYVVDAATAEELVAKNGGWSSPGNGGWPPIMTDEAVKYAASGANNDVYIWCGENGLIYQIDAQGHLTDVGNPGKDFNPAAPPGEIMRKIEASVAQHGATGIVDLAALEDQDIRA